MTFTLVDLNDGATTDTWSGGPEGISSSVVNVAFVPGPTLCNAYAATTTTEYSQYFCKESMVALVVSILTFTMVALAIARPEMLEV